MEVKLKSPFLFWLLLVSIFSCAPLKTDISELDYKRLIRYSSSLRLKYNLEAKDGRTIPNDYDLFLESCDKLKLEPENALQIIKVKNPTIYEQIQKHNPQK